VAKSYGYIDYYDKVVENEEEVTLLQIVNFIVDMEAKNENKIN